MKMKLNIWTAAWALVGAFGTWALIYIYETNHADEGIPVRYLPADGKWVTAMSGVCRDGHRPVLTFLASVDKTKPNDFTDRKSDCSPGRDWNEPIHFGNCADGKPPRVYRGDDALHLNYAADCSPKRDHTPKFPPAHGETQT